MADKITREFKVYSIDAVELGLDDAGNPTKEVVCSLPEVYDMGMTKAKASAYIREQTGIKRLGAGVKIFITELRSVRLAMDIDFFIANSTEIANVESSVEAQAVEAK